MVAPAGFLAVALVLAVDEAVALALCEAVALTFADALPVGLAELVLSLGLVLSLAGLLAVVPSAAGVLLVLPGAGVALGVTCLADCFEADGEGLDGHTVVVALPWLMALLLWLRPVAEDLIWVPVPAALPGPLLLLCGASPAAVPS